MISTFIDEEDPAAAAVVPCELCPSDGDSGGDDGALKIKTKNNGLLYLPQMVIALLLENILQARLLAYLYIHVGVHEAQARSLGQYDANGAFA